MASPSLPPISSLPTADIDTITSVLDTLFEPSPEIHAIALPPIQPKRVLANPGLSPDLLPPPSAARATVPDVPFSSYQALSRHVGTLMLQLAQSPAPESRERLRSILGSHPRLGAKKVDSAQSQAEQAQLNTGGADEAEKLRALNEQYEAKFPGLRYVVFVNGRSRPVIMDDMRRRIDRGDPKAEEIEAVQAMVDIAIDRATKLEAAT
ncbi:Uu.00g078010.m01.CDS01 [Anthostomella pinea]|uniref:Uu.00g078010.m01.CDS01 n=1 Tax=Anthostomella pinea TaxID=933095 RepID=A0AAI8YJ32_9PEZI|nr:Uu.00g078010.m01.CDS01 [Anthostomella pinea]